MSRKVQQCLRFEGVNANGADGSDSDFSSEIQRENDLNDDGTSDDVLSDKCSSDRRIKSNLLSTIKKKWKKSKRSKRPDVLNRTDTNVCHCRRENCELNDCSKQYRPRKQKCGDKNVWPVPSSILRCQNHQTTKNKTDDVVELITSLADESEVCSCFGSPSKKSNCTNTKAERDAASCSKLTTHTSCSLPNVFCEDDTANSSLAHTVESDGDVRLSMLDTNNLDSSTTYASALCPSGENSVDCCQGKDNLPIVPRVGNLTQELHKLSKYGWYWGPINRSEAESKLVDQPDGAFLVRDSSDDRYILSLSFRSCGKTLHTRIEHSSGLFSFYFQPEPSGHASIVELIQQSMCFSQSGVFCYSRCRFPGSPSFPVRFTKPISRFTQVRSLQYLCRFIIRQYTRYDHIQKLPLPPRIKGYLEEGHY